MKKKTLRIILWLLIVLLIWWGITWYILNNWTKYEYYEDWALRQEYTLKNWKKILDDITYYQNWEKRMVHRYDENWLSLGLIKYDCEHYEGVLAEEKDPCIAYYEYERRIYSETWDVYEIERINYDEKWNIVNDYIANWENIQYYTNWKIRTKWNRIWWIEDWIWINFDMSWKEIWKCTYDRWNKISWICMYSDQYRRTNEVEICEYKNDLKNGECRKYDFEWNLVIVDHYKDNKRDWELIDYNEDWSINYKEVYKNWILVE